jgi:hypothetical protein
VCRKSFFSFPASDELLVDEQREKTDSNNENDAKDNHNTRILTGPSSNFTLLQDHVACDNWKIDGRHFEI